MRQNRAITRAADPNGARKRLLAGMLSAIGDDGYAGGTIANVTARAGVSRTTFYEYFTDKDDCFLALDRDISERLLDQITRALNDSPPERALYIVVNQLTEHAETERTHAQFLASDALAGGPRALEERARTIGQISNRVQAAQAAASPQTRSPDLPTQTVVSATHQLISLVFPRFP